MNRHMGKPRVRQGRFALTGETVWVASRTGGTYLFGGGLHFHSWADAIAYVTAPHWPCCGRNRPGPHSIFCRDHPFGMVLTS